MAKKSFFEKLTGAINTNDFSEDVKLDTGKEKEEARSLKIEKEDSEKEEDWLEEGEEGQLTVDVFQTPDEIVIQTMVAGVKPDTLDIQISRDMVTIKGARKDSKVVNDEDFFYRELYWGSFSRTILLPAEVEVEEAEASEAHGLLTLRLPKIDKEKKAKLKVKSTK
jgi:HSP20 family protein